MLRIKTKELENDRTNDRRGYDDLEQELYKLRNIACLIEGYGAKTLKLQRENIRLRFQMGTLTALLSTLRERMTQMQGINRMSPCCQFLLGTCALTKIQVNQSVI